MNPEVAENAGMVQYAIAALTLPGEHESGDRHLVVPTAAGTLVAVVDGLGHGAEAAEAARIALATLERYAEEPTVALVQRCHERMRTTRGAVMSLASFRRRDHTMDWLSVGNVEGVLVRGNEPATRANLLMRGGVVGLCLPVLHSVVVPVFPGNILIFATDGVRSGFEQGLSLAHPLQKIADSICSRYSKGNDDALVLVARYRGDQA